MDPVLQAAVDRRDLDAVVERLSERWALPEDVRRVSRTALREAS